MHLSVKRGIANRNRKSYSFQIWPVHSEGPSEQSPLKILEERVCGRIQGLPDFFGYPRLSQERVKLRNSNFACTFIRSLGTKPIKNFGKSSRGRSQGLPKIFRAPIHTAHRTVIFAIAQLSCLMLQCRQHRAVMTNVICPKGNFNCTERHVLLILITMPTAISTADHAAGSK